MTEDRKKIESCFESVQKISSLHNTLKAVTDILEDNLDYAIGYLYNFDEESEDVVIEIENRDVEVLNDLYSESLRDTMKSLLPHYKTK